MCGWGRTSPRQEEGSVLPPGRPGGQLSVRGSAARPVAPGLWHLGLPATIRDRFAAAGRRAAYALPKIQKYDFLVCSQLDVQQARVQKRCLELVWVSSAERRELMRYPGFSSCPARLEQVDDSICLVRPKASQTLRMWRCETGEPLPLPKGPLEGWWENLCATGRATATSAAQQGLAIRGLMRWEMEETGPGRLVPIHRGIELEAIPLTELPPGFPYGFLPVIGARIWGRSGLCGTQ